MYYDDYYMADDGYRVSACVEGTDCTDCGGVDAIVDYSKVPEPDSGIEACVNTCPYARDGVCDDPRGANYCKLGTDCQDCGPVEYNSPRESNVARDSIKLVVEGTGPPAIAIQFNSFPVIITTATNICTCYFTAQAQKEFFILWYDWFRGEYFPSYSIEEDERK